MNGKTRLNQIFSMPRQQTLVMASADGGYWGSVKDDHWVDDLRVWLEPLTAGHILMPDASWLAIPMAMGKCPLRSGPEPWCITELARMEEGELYPSKRNGVLHRWAHCHIEFLLDMAEELGISPHELPMSHEEAYDADLEPEAIAWPWLRDKLFLDSIEKSVRKLVWQAHPAMHAAVRVEQLFLDANTRCLLETGVHVIEYPTPRSRVGIELQERASQLADDLFGFVWYDLVNCLVLPIWSEWENFEQPFFTHSTPEGFFVDQPGWRMSETLELHRYLGSIRTHRMFDTEHPDSYMLLSDKVTEAARRLGVLATSAINRQNQDLTYA